MSFLLRPLQPSMDYAWVAEIESTIGPEPVTAEMLKDYARRRPEGEVRYEVVAVAEGGRVVGMGASGRRISHPPGHFWLRILVDSTARRQGIGSALYEVATQWAQAQGATRFTTDVREREAEGLVFAQNRGFQIERHHFESVLDVAAFDARPFAGIVENLQAQGLRFFSFAETDQSLEQKRRLHELNTITGNDIPGADPAHVWPFEDFVRDIFDSYWFRSDGQIFAADGDVWVGMAAVGEMAPGAMYNMMTGVRQAYRGRHIALALKLLAIAFCRRHRAQTLRTNNNSANAPILALNRKLGYQPEPGYYSMAKAMSE